MAKIFDIDFRNSTVDKITGSQATFNTCEIKRLDKGNAVVHTGITPSRTSFADTNVGNFGTGNFSVVFWFRFNPSGTNSIFNKYIGASDFYQFVVNGNNQFSVYSKTSNITVVLANTTPALLPNKDYCVVVSITRGSPVQFYINGELVASLTSTTPTAASMSYATPLSIGSYSTYFYKNTIYRCIGYDHILTEQERANAYKDFLNSYPTVQEKYPNVINKPMDLSSEKERTLETEILNPIDFTSGTWIDVGTVSGKTANGFTTGTAFDGLYKGCLTTGKRYRCRISGTVDQVFAVMYSDGITNYSGNINPGTFNVSFDFTSVGVNLFLRLTAAGVLSNVVLYLSELTGLIAAYNFIPNGNTLVDISGNGKPLTISNTISIKNGIKLNLASSITVGSAILNQSVWSVNMVLKNAILATINCLLSSSSASLNGSIYITSTGNLTYRVSAGEILTIGSVGICSENSVISIISNGTTIVGYLNGVSIGAGITPTTTTLTASYLFNTTYKFTAVSLLDMRFYNRVLTIKEIKDYSNLFVQPSLNVCFCDEGASGTSIVPSGWNRVSGAFKISEYQPVRGERVPSNNDFTSGAGWALGVGTTIADSKLKNDGTNGVLTFTNHNVGTYCFYPGKTYRVTCKIDALSGGVGRFQVGSGSGTWAQFWTTDIGIKSQIYQPTTGTGGFYFGFPANVIAEIDWVTVEEISPLPTFKPGTKYLECVTAGVIAIPSKQAYGSWEFDLYKGADANDAYVFFTGLKQFPVGSVSSGYLVRLVSTEAIWLRMDSNTRIASASSYTAINTWYSIRITRSLAGIFTLLIKGGTFAPTVGYDGWTLVSVTGGSGINPYTDTTYSTSEYFVLDLDAGDRIANIQLTDGIKQL